MTRDELIRLPDEYYGERRWDRESGDPTPEKLKDFGLEGFITSD